MQVQSVCKKEWSAHIYIFSVLMQAGENCVSATQDIFSYCDTCVYVCNAFWWMQS